MTLPAMSDASGDERPLPIDSMGKGSIALILVLALLRLLLGAAFIILLLTLVPKNPGDPVVYPILMCVFGIILYVWFFRRQVRSVYKSRFPTLRAVEALILVAGMFLAIFTMVYVVLSIHDPSAFTEPLDSFTGYYFSLTVLATVGFGDITPVTTMARSFTMVQMALDIAFLGIVIKVMTSAARRAIQQRDRREARIGEDPKARTADTEVSS